jgi:fermentation-respiration switch protein FrsA (DUF1100 family)
MKRISLCLLTLLFAGCTTAPVAKKHLEPTTFPYKREEVTFKNTKGGNSLAGTLTTPANGKVFKIVVLITGSGPQNRDEEIKQINLRPFLVLSDWLTRDGIAVLRYDDRGVGKSTGIFAKANTADLADDADAAVNYIQSRRDLKDLSIGLIGHSEGGVIAPMVASRNKAVKFICLLAGPGVPTHEAMIQQGKNRMRLNGTSADDQKIMLAGTEDIYRILRDNAGLSLAKLKVKVDSMLYRNTQNAPTRLLHGKSVDEVVKLTSKQLLSPWIRYFILFDPADYLTKVKCPVLALNGTLDSQVECATNLAAIKNALQKGGNNNHQEIALPGLNHEFQKAKTGAESEYSQIYETMNPKALEQVSTWINGLK